MSTTTVSKSIQIDAPVEKVFDFIANPHTFYQAWPFDWDYTISDEAKAPDGSVMSFKVTWSIPIGRLHYDSQFTIIRKEYVPNERLVQEAPMVLDSYIFEPSGDGTLLTNTTEVSSRVPLLDKAGILITTRGEGMDRVTEEFLAKVKEFLEA